MTAPAACAPPLPALHAAFLALVPQIERHGRIHLRGLKSGDALEEAIAEMIALAWKWFLGLVARGKDPGRFPRMIASYAARAVWSGRGVCGRPKCTDVFSAAAQRRRGLTVRPLPVPGALRDNPSEYALADRTVGTVDEQVAFRMDFLLWLSALSDRDRGTATDLMAGARTRQVADKDGLSCNRVFQKRAQFRDRWRRFRKERSEKADVASRPRRVADEGCSHSPGEGSAVTPAGPVTGAPLELPHETSEAESTACPDATGHDRR